MQQGSPKARFQGLPCCIQKTAGEAVGLRPCPQPPIAVTPRRTWAGPRQRDGPNPAASQAKKIYHQKVRKAE